MFEEEIEINSLEDLLKLLDECGYFLILKKDNAGLLEIEIYDDYRE